MIPPSLADVIAALEILAPPPLAAPWDNTGLLLEGRTRDISRVLLTLDLTPAVAAEALRTKTSLILSYHPPIFDGLKRLTRANPLTAALLDLHLAGISLYSPHTALDAAPGGISDWISSALDPCSCETLDGSGRLLTLRRAASLSSICKTFSELLQLPYLRIAKAPDGPTRIRRVALCPGSGASVLRDADADLVFTGELKHHDILAFTRRRVHAVISEHSHTERPYLSELRKRLLHALPNLGNVALARSDREPLTLQFPAAHPRTSRERP